MENSNHSAPVGFTVWQQVAVPILTEVPTSLISRFPW